MTVETELLDRLRALNEAFPTITRVEVDQYQLSLLTESGIGITSYVGWLSMTEAKSERLDADYRNRTGEDYAVCRIVGRDILSIDFDDEGNLVLGLEVGEKLLILRIRDFENFMIGAESLGPHIF
jgi:hypothetical protein